VAMEELEDSRSYIERVDDAVRTLQFLLRERLTTTEYAVLRERWVATAVDLRAVVVLVTRAKRENTLDEAVRDLKTFLVAR